MVTKEVFKDKHGPIVVVEASSQSLHEARSELESLNCKYKINLELKDPTSLEAIRSLRASVDQSHPTFNVTFAKNVLHRNPDASSLDQSYYTIHWSHQWDCGLVGLMI